MSALLSACCCDEAATCCACTLASSYSVAVTASYDSQTFGNTGSPQTLVDVESAFSFTGLTVTQPSSPCVLGQIPNFPATAVTTWAVTKFDLQATALTTAAIICAIDSTYCPNTSETSIPGTPPSGDGGCTAPREGLICVHEINASIGLDIFYWMLSVDWQSSATCGGATDPFEYTWAVCAYSTPQSTCHAPPSSGWSASPPTDTSSDAYKSALIFGRLNVSDCYFVPTWPGTCTLGGSTANTNEVISVTIT